LEQEPAGLQLGYFLQQAGREYLIVEAGDSAPLFSETFPRHRRLISINKPHTGCDDPELNLRMDWNSLLCDDPRLRFPHYTERYFPDADMMVQYLADFAAAFGLRIASKSRIIRICRDGNFHASMSADSATRRSGLITASGLAKPYVPPIPGIETADCMETLSVDPRELSTARADYRQR